MTLKKRIAAQRKRRQFRVRNRVRKIGHPRLNVFRSNKHIYAQLIDDTAGHTLAAASSLESAVAGKGTAAGNKAAAEKVGKLIAERAIEKGIGQVVFDRGQYKYHGRVAALADAAREGGLNF